MCNDFFVNFDGLDWEGFLVLPFVVDLTREKREKDRIRRDNGGSDGDYWT